jgi:two-component system sensor histidine kinase/response regulator
MSEAAVTSPSARILIVDDEKAQMEALLNTLQFEGYRTTGFSSPQKALAELKAGEYEVLLTDLKMPEMDGIELIRAARQKDPDIVGIVMTGHGTIDTAVAAMQGGALDYVLKPFKLNAILTVIGRALETRRLRLENAMLQQREREQAAELAAAYRDLESFSYSVSHDLRSPLRAIRGFTEMYLEEFGSTVPEQGRTYLQRVAEGAERMDQLIEDLLKFCRFSRAPLRKQKVDLDAAVRRIIADLQAREPQRAVHIEIGELPPCDGDPSLLQQVLINLLSNAFKFTRQKQPAQIAVGSFVADSPVHPGSTERVYFVRDNGAGFNPKYADKLFGVFQRLHSADEFEGTGVGLSIVQRVLQRHGGRIWAEGAPGQGATFYFVV